VGRRDVIKIERKLVEIALPSIYAIGQTLIFLNVDNAIKLNKDVIQIGVKLAMIVLHLLKLIDVTDQRE